MRKNVLSGERYGFYDSPFGRMRIGYIGQEITSLSVIGTEGGLAESVPSDLTNRAAGQLEEYFAGKRRSFDLPLKMTGTEFQKRVWRALCDIPYGETRSYRDIAEAVGNPKACRAVGGANNKNPIAIIVPCHRVIGADGSLVGYASGLDMKTKLLELERKNAIKE